MSSPTTHFAPTSHSDPPLREIVELACRAPSVHNTQPWVWRAHGQEIELHADRQRQLTYADTLGRNLILSCGAALNHAQVAAAGLGWHTSVTRNPKDRDPDHLATITVAPGRLTTESEADLKALEERRTDRRRFTSWPVPEERLTNLATSVAGWGALAVPVTDSGTRGTLERLILRADDVQRHDPRYTAEAERWVARSAEDGVPLASIPEDHPHRPERPSRFTHGELPDVPPEAIEGSDALMVLCTVRDDAASWLRCGETLGALWLSAVRKGLSLVPLSQVLEVEETRVALREAVLGGMATPQLLLRIGWQEVARAPLPPTPRRPLEEVLRP